jgi:tRNA isopentenyl-2-thiomethyl-A-37 hydroxylase MiaE
MKMYADLWKALDSNDTILARSVIIGYANESVIKLKGALEHIESKSQSIFVPHDEYLYPINSDRPAWDEDYWHGLTGDMMHNFSRERLDHMVQVAEYLQKKPNIVTAKDMRIDPAIKVELDKLIREGEPIRLRSELVGMANTNIKSVFDAFLYVVSKMPDVLQTHEEDLYPIERDENAWDKDYWNGLTGDMMHNFSKERFEHMLQVEQYINRTDMPGSSQPEENVENKSSDGERTYGSSTVDNPLVYILVAVGVVLAVPIALWLLFKN